MYKDDITVQEGLFSVKGQNITSEIWEIGKAVGYLKHLQFVVCLLWWKFWVKVVGFNVGRVASIFNRNWWGWSSIFIVNSLSVLKDSRREWVLFSFLLNHPHKFELTNFSLSFYFAKWDNIFSCVSSVYNIYVSLSEGDPLGSVPPNYLTYRAYIYFQYYFIFILQFFQNGLTGVVFQIKGTVLILISVFVLGLQYEI